MEPAASPPAWSVPRVGIAAAAAGAWFVLVASSPDAFFAIAAPFCTAWIVLSARASPPGLRARLAPAATDVALGVVAALALYAVTRLFLWAACGGLTDALSRPLAEVMGRFHTRALGPALVLGLLVAPGEELFWRGVVQAHLARKLPTAAAVVAATALAVCAALATGEPFLALATAPTYAAWGALTAWRRSLVPALVSHALWSVLVASVAPPL
jgi:membrane protease YdiL (CAAX protease family)